MVSRVRSTVLHTDRNVGVVVPTALRHDINPFLRTLEKKLLEEGIMPKFRIMVAPLRGIKVQASIAEGLGSTIITVGEPGIGQRISAGFDACSKTADSMLFIPDDFDHLSKSIPGFVASISHKKPVLMGRWDEYSAATLPYPAWLAEAGLSTAMTCLFSNGKIDLPEPEGLAAFAGAFRSSSFWTQVYFGVIGVASERWPNISEKIRSMFSSASVAGPGLELAITLAARDSGYEASMHTLPRRFEHPMGIAPGSDEEQRFVQGRLNQFEQGMFVLKEYQLLHVDAGVNIFLEQMHAKLSSSSFQWPGRRIAATRWNSQVRTLY
ncbi:Uncharacterised protein [Candidatus Burarchaeum australiense]|nr:Uncharacterised protein [Candidatus Burarchaeum australiense]